MINTVRYTNLGIWQTNFNIAFYNQNAITSPIHPLRMGTKWNSKDPKKRIWLDYNVTHFRYAVDLHVLTNHTTISNCRGGSGAVTTVLQN